MDRGQLLEIGAHYVAMLLSLFLLLAVVRALVGETGFWTELAIVLLIAVSYRPVVRRLGVAPSAWEER